MAYDMSIRAYAKRRGVTPAAVRKAIKSGRITTENGKIDPEIADAQWSQNTDEAKRHEGVARDPASFQRPAAEPTIPSLGLPGHGLPRAGGYAAARAVRETYEARLRELDYKVRTGELVPVHDVRLAAFNSARRARDLLLAIPDRVSAVIAGLSEVAEVHRVLTEEIRRVCEELSRPLTFGKDDRADLN